MKYVCPACKGKRCFAIGDGNDGQNCSTCHGEGYIVLVPYVEPHEHEWTTVHVNCPDGNEGCLVYHTANICVKCGIRKGDE